jgi:hypothetical protein
VERTQEWDFIQGLRDIVIVYFEVDFSQIYIRVSPLVGWKPCCIDFVEVLFIKCAAACPHARFLTEMETASTDFGIKTQHVD